MREQEEKEGSKDEKVKSKERKTRQKNLKGYFLKCFLQVIVITNLFFCLFVFVLMK